MHETSPACVTQPQVFLTPDYLAITMEYASGGDLFSLVGRSKGLSEEDARWYFQQLVVSVDYCHRMVRRRKQLPVFQNPHGSTFPICLPDGQAPCL